MELNIDFEQEKITWTYGSVEYEYYAEGIEDATVINDSVIFVETYANDNPGSGYVSLDGKDLLWYYYKGPTYLFNPVNGTRCEIDVPGVQGVGVTQESAVIITSQNLYIYDFNGNKKASLAVPFGYLFDRIVDADSLKVVCTGGRYEADQYGRNEWVFEFVNGTWNKTSLAV